MYELFFLVFFLLVIPFGFFALFSWAFLYHIKTYGYKEKTNRQVALVFSLITLAFCIFTLVRFGAVDWERVSIVDFLKKSGLNSLSGLL